MTHARVRRPVAGGQRDRCGGPPRGPTMAPDTQPVQEENPMLLESKTAVVYGGGGSIGSAMARGFAAEGARCVLVGRTPDTLDAAADRIRADGGQVETAVVDALDE